MTTETGLEDALRVLQKKLAVPTLKILKSMYVRILTSVKICKYQQN